MSNRAAEIIYSNSLCTQLLAAENAEAVVGRRVEKILFPLPDWSLAPYQGTRFLGSSKVLRCDSDLIEVDIYGGFVNWEGEPAAFLFLRDVKERRVAERNLHDHINNLNKHLKLVRHAALKSRCKVIRRRNPLIQPIGQKVKFWKI